MRGRNTIGWAVLAIVLFAGGCSTPEASPTPDTKADQAEIAPKLEPAAAARLKAMSATLASAQAFSFTTSGRRERINPAGEKVARESTNQFFTVRPDRFWWKRTREGKTQLVIYDGSTLTLQGDGEKVWAQVDMPPTLDQALDYVAEVYRVPIPIADLLYSDPYGSIVGENTGLRMAGKETIGGAECDHLVVETPAVDAELWLATGASALPCKLELVREEERGALRTSVVFSDWNLSPQVEATRFAFAPPAGYQRIRMVAVMSPQEEALSHAAEAKREAQDAPAPNPGS